MAHPSLQSGPDIRVGVSHNPCGTHYEDHADDIKFANGDFGLITLITKLQDQTVQTFQRAQIVAEERFEDSDQCDDRSTVFQNGREGRLGAGQ